MGMNKKIKLLLIVVVAMLALVGCGVKEPTQAEIEEALLDEAYIVEKEEGMEKEYSWTVDVTKNKLNDDKDRATVECTLNIKDGPVETVAQYEIEFKLRDNKEWMRNEVEEISKTSAIVSGVDDNEMILLLKTETFEIPGVDDYYKIVGDRSVEIVSHELNSEKLTDTVIANISGESETKKYNLEVMAVMYCYMDEDEGATWYLTELDIKEIYEVKDSDSYSFDKSVEGVMELIGSSGIEIYSSGTYNYLEADMISNMSVGEFVPYGMDDKGYMTDCIFTADCNGVLMDIEATLKFEYANGRWQYDGTILGEENIVSYKYTGMGIWEGTHDKLGNVTIEIPVEPNEKGEHILTVTIDSPDNGTYSYLLKVYAYGSDGYSIENFFKEWITLPANGDELAYSEFDGNIYVGEDETFWASDDALENFTLTMTESYLDDAE